MARGRTGERDLRTPLTLGDGVDLENIAASYTNGVLMLTLPVAEAAKPRKIAVDSGEAAPISLPTGDASSGCRVISSRALDGWKWLAPWGWRRSRRWRVRFIRHGTRQSSNRRKR